MGDADGVWAIALTRTAAFVLRTEPASGLRRSGFNRLSQGER